MTLRSAWGAVIAFASIAGRLRRRKTGVVYLVLTGVRAILPIGAFVVSGIDNVRGAAWSPVAYQRTAMFFALGRMACLLRARRRVKGRFATRPDRRDVAPPLRDLPWRQS